MSKIFIHGDSRSAAIGSVEAENSKNCSGVWVKNSFSVIAMRSVDARFAR